MTRWPIPLVLASTVLLAAPGSPGARAAETGQGLTLSYDGVLLVKVLDLQLHERAGGAAFSTRAKLKSYGILALFKKIDVEAAANGRLEAGRPQPSTFSHINRDGENRSVEVRWTETDVATRVSVPYLSAGDPAPTRAQKLAAADPLTQLTRIAMTGPGRRPCGDDLTFFDGRQLYRLAFDPPTARAPTPREQQLGLVQPIRCRFTFTEVAGFDPKPPQKQNQGLGSQPLAMDLARLGPDGPWVIAAVRGKTPLGEAKIELRNMDGA